MIDFLLKLYKKPRLIFIDLLLINLALIFGFILRFDGSWLSHFSYSYSIILSIIGLTILYFSGLYKKMWRYASINELKSIIKIVTLINLSFTLYIFLAQISFSRSVVIISGVLDLLFLGGLRFILRLTKDYLEYERCNDAGIKVLIVGAGDAAEILIREMYKHPELGKEVIGLVDDDSEKIGLEIHGKRVLGDRHDIPDIIAKRDVSEVIIAIPSTSGEAIKNIYDLSNQTGVEIKIVPGLDEIINGGFNLNQIREVKVEDLLKRDQVDLNTEGISSYLQAKTVLVTGGGGSIGAELCRQIIRFNPEQLIIFDISENNTYFIELELKDDYNNIEVIPVIGSIRDKQKLRQTFAEYQPDVVFHAAAHKHVPLMEYNPEEAIKNNVLGTKNVAETADEFNVERFVLVSTDKAVNPTNVMGATKRTAEMIAQAINNKSKTKFMAVRFGNVLGSKGSVIPLFKRQIAQGGPVTVTHKEVERYFMTIPEAAQLVIQAGSLGQGGEVFVLDMGEAVKIIDLAKDLIKLSGLELGEDIDIEVIGLRPGEKLYEELLYDGEDSIATDHERIFITNLESVNQKVLYDDINKLERLIKISDSSAIVNALVNLVGTYEPNRDNMERIS
ncbi:polysaccharide biosynthesis protein [Selenihalanaerobacter shriftii]|uniref:NDP-sugar epimerase, includes UDP-GlcNAc-inverting 4,6-dehydratase FlaA1 and capsular polysaccharide biosynthesis protein EpsC n=1 Tax=Selenihalanaerobacter shriftii TaxID=142842 RepID=A0A1T4R0E0_9FIRM|nr:nucleoside-diphosphate sugar epimerase/dehydratase [Selenihalanaerobacter shriftii]SKA09454.1 NDP-sugar epimerase, includes UDP-GlcNAc-inverting 4,6-dehydratase FlaA1 and capsular polysaccharide biosynthesis protein EpsC [Selenihalanaerobacter shriftii]